MAISIFISALVQEDKYYPAAALVDKSSAGIGTASTIPTPSDLNHSSRRNFIGRIFGCKYISVICRLESFKITDSEGAPTTMAASSAKKNEPKR